MSKIGMFVTSVMPNSLSDKAGVKPGDHLIAINNHPINSMDDYIDVTLMPKEKSHTYDIIRDNEYLSLTVET